MLQIEQDDDGREYEIVVFPWDTIVGSDAVETMPTFAIKDLQSSIDATSVSIHSLSPSIVSHSCVQNYSIFSFFFAGFAPPPDERLGTRK